MPQSRLLLILITTLKIQVYGWPNTPPRKRLFEKLQKHFKDRISVRSL